MGLLDVIFVVLIGAAAALGQQTQPAEAPPIVRPVQEQPPNADSTTQPADDAGDRVDDQAAPASAPAPTTLPSDDDTVDGGSSENYPTPVVVLPERLFDRNAGTRHHPPDLETIRNEAARWIAAYTTAGSSQRVLIARQLEQLASRCDQLVMSLSNPTDQLEAGSVALQVYHTLALGAGRQHTAVDRLSQLQKTAWKTIQLNTAGSKSLGEFWLLGVELFDIYRAEIDLDIRQSLAIERLERFVQKQALNTPHDDKSGQIHGSVLKTVRLALLALYDQRGMSGDACKLVASLRDDVPYDDMQTRSFLDRRYGYCPIIGHQFEAQVQADNGGIWSSKAYEGRPILLHFWAWWAQPSVDAFEPLKSKYEQHGSENLAILSVCLGSSEGYGTSPMAVGWPTCVQPIEQPDSPTLAQLFGVDSLPRYVLIDAQGRVTAIGGSLSIFEQIESFGAVDRNRVDNAPPEGVVGAQEIAGKQVKTPSPIEDSPSSANKTGTGNLPDPPAQPADILPPATLAPATQRD